MHSRQRLHQALGPTSILLDRTDEQDAGRLTARSIKYQMCYMSTSIVSGHISRVCFVCRDLMWNMHVIHHSHTYDY